MAITAVNNWLSRACYRVWQFYRIVNPKVDPIQYLEIRKKIPLRWRPYLDKLRPSEKSHILRICQSISRADNLTPEEREKLTILAITHDLGKTVTRPQLWERIFKTLFPLPNRGHPTQGAKILRKLGAPARMVSQVARHHDPNRKDRLLRLFQTFDNSD